MYIGFELLLETSAMFYIILVAACITLFLMIVSTIYDIIKECKLRKFKDDIISTLEFYRDNFIQNDDENYIKGFNDCVDIVKKRERRK